MIDQYIYDELKKFRGGPLQRPEGPTEMIRYLTEEGFIEAVESNVFPGLSVVPVKWKITVKGLAALSEFEEQRQKEAQNERQRRFQNKISVLNVLVPLITFLLGLIVEHFAGLLDFLASLFHV